jgi:ubiquinone/menaquinone biosynthesis C-methylase UbiE
MLHKGVTRIMHKNANECRESLASSHSDFEKFSKEIGFICNIEDWAKKHRQNVYVAVHEHDEIKDGIVRELKNKKVTSVFDLGCGYGFLMSKLNRACRKITIVGGDISTFQVENAKSRNVQGSLVVCCGEYIPFKENTFDCVVCSEVIEHTVDPKATLQEMERVVKYGGYLCVTTDNPHSVYRRIVKHFRGIKPLILGETGKTSYKEEFISLNQLIELMPQNIKIYDVRYTCPYPLLPDVGSIFGSELVGKCWVYLGNIVEKLPHVGKVFYNKYGVFGIKNRRVLVS